MNNKETDDLDSTKIAARVRNFYDLRPYPPPVEDLDQYRVRWQDETRKRANYYLHWPTKPYREDLNILVAGCGTSQAAKHALRQPAARVVGIDVSQTSIHHTQVLKHKYNLENLEVYQLPLERADELGTSFDKIICTGVLHHLPNPIGGLQTLREVLQPEGALNLMIYAAYGRVGIVMLQKYARLLGVGNSDVEINDFARTLMALPEEHPIARLLGQSPDFRTKAGLADALLNPHDRSYTVPQLFELITEAGMRFGRWVRQAPYLPQCGAFAETPHTTRLRELPLPEQYAALELLRGTMLRHNLILYHDDHSGGNQPIRFEEDEWLSYKPIRMTETILVKERLPRGASGVLINQNHTYPDLFMPLEALELKLYENIDGKLSISEILSTLPSDTAQKGERARTFFERLWWYDQVIFDASQGVS